MARPRRNWTAEEDIILKREVKRVQTDGDNVSWHEIAAFLPGRTNKDCRKRWHGTTAAKVKKGPWTEVEDERLRRAIARHGTKWAVVASVVGTRLPDQCSKRWSHAVNPAIDHSPWTAQEDELLIQVVDRHGHYWQRIVSVYFPGRTSLAAKNRYHILQRRLRTERRRGEAWGLEQLEASSWPEIMWPQQSQARGCVQDMISNTSETSVGQHGWLPSISHSPFYNNLGDFTGESTELPFPSKTADNSLDSGLPSSITMDDFALQTISLETPLFSSLSDANSPSEPKANFAQRRVYIQAVCSTDKLGAMFEAVTKFSISAVIKTDD
ncbi:hypothetical protein BDW62DRAFT_204386 [Aspergillus aurantiobrunneus]